MSQLELLLKGSLELPLEDPTSLLEEIASDMVGKSRLIQERNPEHQEFLAKFVSSTKGISGQHLEILKKKYFELLENPRELSIDFILGLIRTLEIMVMLATKVPEYEMFLREDYERHFCNSVIQGNLKAPLTPPKDTPSEEHSKPQSS